MNLKNKNSSILSNSFICFQEKIVVPNLSNLSLYVCQYDRTLYRADLFDQYGVVYTGYIDGAVDKRKAEYLAGRYSATLALKELGITTFDILTGQHRSPIWPKGVLGSITHTIDKAYAAVGYCTDFNCIGIDYEQIVTSKTAENIKSMILSDGEYSLLVNSDFEFETILTIVFSAKESLFKALFPSVGNYFDFFAAEMTYISKKDWSFELKLKQSLTKQLIMGTCFKGWFQVESKNILTVIGIMCVNQHFPTNGVVWKNPQKC